MFLRKVLIVLTKRLVPITRLFLESQLIFIFLKNPGKSGFKNESKCISRALALLSQKKTQQNQFVEKFLHNLN